MSEVKDRMKNIMATIYLSSLLKDKEWPEQATHLRKDTAAKLKYFSEKHNENSKGYRRVTNR